jgi:uncharacterized protein YkwD
MLPRIVAVVLGVFMIPCLARAQSADHEDVEKVEIPGGAIAPDRNVDLDRVAGEIVERTNEFRKEKNREPVESNARLKEGARYFAGYMARTDTYGHTADDKRPADRAKEHGYKYCIVLENIAYQYSSAGFDTTSLAKRFFEGWKESPGHRRNMLDEDVTETGVAVARSDETGVYYAVQVFGRPKSKSIDFRIENHSGAEIEYRIGDRTFPLPPRLIRTHERCRPQDLVFEFPDGEKDMKGKTRTVRPEDGDRYTVVRNGDGFALRKQ